MGPDQLPGWNENDLNKEESFKGTFPCLYTLDGKEGQPKLAITEDYLPVNVSITIRKTTATTSDLELWEKAFSEGYQKAKFEDRDD